MQRKLIYNEEVVKNFVENYLPDLEQGEVYFTSLSARNKYLTTEEREEYSLCKTEMFERKLVRRKEKFLPVLRRYECDEMAYVTRNGKPIPEKAIVCYLNINPSSAVKAASEVMAKIQEDALMVVNSQSHADQTIRGLEKLDIKVMNAFQRNKGTRHFIDIDFDIPDSEESYDLFQECVQKLIEKELKFFVVQTKGGFHVVVHKSSIKFNYTFLLEAMEYEFQCLVSSEEEKDKIEVFQNKNEMIPVPGTYQGGFEVVLREDLSNC
jgi:hypothetical protein